MAGLVLGGVSFSGFEIPNEINFGGKHNVTVHQLIGGGRVLDAMGGKPDQIQWKGRFRGPSAIGRAQQIDELRIAGSQVDLAWLNLFRSVIVVSFTAHTEKSYEVPYEITCEVVNDAALGLGGFFQSIDALVSGDIVAATGFTANPTASSLVSVLSSAISTIGPLAGATAASRTTAALAANTATTSLQLAVTANDATLGKTMPLDLAENLSAWLLAQNAGTLVQADTLDILGYVARVNSNIAAVKA